MNSMDNPSQINRRLSIATFITSIGDWISYFALIAFIYRSTGNAVLAAYVVPVRSLSVAVGGAMVPYIFRWFDLKHLILLSQFLSSLILVVLIGLITTTSSPNPYLIIFLVFINTLLKQFFDTARESYSKDLSLTHQQRSAQAEILQGLYGAQFLGPLIAVAGLLVIPIWVLLLLDAISFIGSGIVCMNLPLKKTTYPTSLFRPIGYLFQTNGLAAIFFIRSIGFWIPISIMNIALFSITTTRFGSAIENTALFYAATGFGSLVASVLLHTNRLRISNHLKNLSDAKIAAIALSLLALTRIAVLHVPTFIGALGIFIITGLCNGSNAVTSQSLRRKLTTQQQFPEIVGLEIVVGKITDWLAATIFALLIANGIITYETAVLISAILLIPLALAHVIPSLRNR